jgi:hypothetical protein
MDICPGPLTEAFTTTLALTTFTRYNAVGEREDDDVPQLGRSVRNDAPP